MTAITSMILWMAVQTALFSVVGAGAFLWLRRRGPAVATSFAVTVLALTLPLAALMMSPWPRWFSGDDGNRSSVAANVGREATKVYESTAGDELNPANLGVMSLPPIEQRWWQSAAELIDAKDVAPTSNQRSVITWRTWLPWMLGIGIAIGLVRLGLGVAMVNRYRRSSRLINDLTLASLARKLSAEFQTGQFELRECAALRSAATIGWRKPVLLLPTDWPSWNETERRTVLAHELAHIARRDYLTALLARLVTAIHFYQPLVLWLGRQLRIEQELAADHCAAMVAGDRQSYLETLAQIALRADDQPLPWAARAFLPGTSMLIKRVAWLKRKGPTAERAMGRGARYALLFGMALIALAVAGIRGSIQSLDSAAVATAADDVITAPTAKFSRAFTYVPADAKLVAVISSSCLSESASLSKLLPPMSEALEKKFGLKVADIEDIELIKTTATALADKTGTPRFERMIIRAAKPHDWKATLQRASENNNVQPMKLEEFHGKQYFAADPQSAYVADDRTLIVGTEEEIQKIIGGGEREMNDDQFPEFQNPIAVRVDMSAVRKAIGMDNRAKLFESNPVLAMFLPPIEHVQVARLCGGVGANDRGFIDYTLECDSAEAAQAAAKTLEAARTVALNLLKAKAQAWQESPAPAVPAIQIVSTNDFFNALMKALGEANFKNEGTVVRGGAELEMGPDVVAGFAMPAIAASREAAMRQQTMNNIKQISLAMYLYNDVNKHFPPAAIRDKDGKPLLSWRVAILPYLDLKLYKEFHLDEPWNSEHNKALVAKMPALFRDPHEDETSTNASYFMPTGKGMFGGNAEGIKPQEITDGSAQTIMLVEAKREIPWTKPEDIEIDPNATKPLPKLGGHIQPEGLFAAAFADGHVEAILSSIDIRKLHAMFTVGDGEFQPNVTPPAAVPKTQVPTEPMPPGTSYIVPTPPVPASLTGTGALAAKPLRNIQATIYLKHETDGTIGWYWDFQGKLTEAELRKRLADIANKEDAIGVSADLEGVPQQAIVDVMDLIAAAGLHKVRLASPATPYPTSTAVYQSAGPTTSGVQPQRVGADAQPAKVEFELSEITKRLTNDGKPVYETHNLGPVDLRLEDIQEASAGRDESGHAVVSIKMTPAGAKKMAAITESNLGKTLLILVDGRAVLQPKIVSTISDKLQISGAFSKEEAQQIVDRLNGK